MFQYFSDFCLKGGDSLAIFFKGFGKRLKQAIKESTYTQKDLSEIIQINQDTLTNYVKEKSFPDAKILLELCHLLGKSADWLLTGEKLNEGTLSLKEQPASYQVDELRSLDAQERDMLWKYRQLDGRDQLDAKENIEMKYNRLTKKGMSSSSRSGRKGSEEEAATKEQT